MDPIVFLKPPKIDPAVWRPDVPLVVIERCLTAARASGEKKVDPSKLICTWLAIRWLMAAFPKRRGFPTRLIAERAGAHMTSITAWCHKLMLLGLLSQVGEEPIVRNLAHATPIYSIPLSELERISHDICLEILIKLGGESDETESQSSDQLTLDLPLPDATQKSFSDRLSDQTSDRLSDHRDGRTDDHGTDDHARAREKKPRGRPKNAPPVPPAPPNQPPLPHHPLVLWANACTTPRSIDGAQLEALAAAHDEATAGYGLYWVGRAILAASADEDVRSIRKVKTILDRWHDTQSYGSDRYQKEAANGREQVSSPGQSRDGSERPRRGDRREDRQRPSGRSGRAPRPGDPAYYDRYRDRASDDGPADDE